MNSKGSTWFGVTKRASGCRDIPRLLKSPPFTSNRGSSLSLCRGSPEREPKRRGVVGSSSPEGLSVKPAEVSNFMLLLDFSFAVNVALGSTGSPVTCAMALVVSNSKCAGEV